MEMKVLIGWFFCKRHNLFFCQPIEEGLTGVYECPKNPEDHPLSSPVPPIRTLDSKVVSFFITKEKSEENDAFQTGQSQTFNFKK